MPGRKRATIRELAEHTGLSPAAVSYAWQLLFFAGPLVLFHGYEAWRDDLKAIFTMRPATRYAICLALFYVTVLWGEFGGGEFIYFRF